MLDELGQANLLVDRRAWPMAVTRRVAARGGGYAAAVVAGTAMLAAPVLAGAAAADCARYLRRVRADGRPVDDLVAETVARKERVMGFGRPLVGPDERVPIMQATLARYGRDDGPYVTLLHQVEAAFSARKGLRSTSAAWAAAVLTDLGLTPDAVQAVSNYWVAVCIYAQALFSSERAR
jgi:citrate synthase